MNEVIFYISLSVISFIGGMILGMSIISHTGKIAIRKVQKERLEEAIEEANKDIDLLNEEQKEWARGCMYGLMQSYKLMYGVEYEGKEINNETDN